MKRQRGLKRYYKNLDIQVEFERSDFKINFENPMTWLKYDHWHFDSNALGNNSFKRRKPHLDKLFRHFDFLVGKTANCKFDFQLYSVLLDFDSSADALFLHKPDGNNRQFPFKIEELSGTTTLKNEELDKFINNLTGYEKSYGHANQSFCLLFKREVGLPFH
jgi:hypothetical protein